MRRGCKIIFANIFVVALVLGSFSATFAENITSAMAVNVQGATGQLEGFISKNVFKVVLPTIPETNVDKDEFQVEPFLNFIVDPTGVTADKNTDKKVEPNATLYFPNTEASAAYDLSHISDALTIKNKSTMNVDVRLKAELSGMGNIRLTSDEKFVNDKSASVYLALTDGRGKTSAIDTYGAFLKATLRGCPEAYKTIYDFGNEKYDYVLKDDSELSAANIKFPDYTFQLTGASNTVNSWTDLGELDPKIQVTWWVSPRPDNVAPSIEKTSYTMEKDKPISIEVDLGSGTLAAKGIDSITYTKSTGALTVLPTSNYTLTEGTLKIEGAYIASVVDAGIETRDYQVMFNDAARTQETITLTADNVSAPSIDRKEYNMVIDKDILVSVDLGSGNLKATGIKSIAYTKVSGEKATLADNNYAFDGDMLNIKGSYISSVICSGVASREYTIIFNDKAETPVTIKLTADGSAPTITPTSCTMERGKSVEMDVDLGSGYLGAKKIKEITYVNSTGNQATLNDTNYTFGSGKLTFTPEYITSVIRVGTVSRDYTIIFDNVAETKVIVRLTAKEERPSDQPASYSMVSGKDLPIDVDLGSGSIGATGIKSIEYINTSGATVNLAPDKYTLTGEVLTIKGSYIFTVIDAGVTSRKYTIVFNDVNATRKEVSLTAVGTIPSIATSSYTMRRGSSVEVTVDPGSGDLAEKGISSITYTNSSGALTTLATANYTYANRKITFDASYIASVISVGTKSRDYTVNFNNVAKTKVKITFIAENKVPSIQQLSHQMAKGRDVLINVDLGSGNGIATGIKSITYTKTSGAMTTLAADNYSLSNGVLTIKSSYTDTVISAGVTSRPYTVTFNNNASTAVTVTFIAENKAPSIQQLSYQMAKGRDVLINVDLGSGNGIATGIKSITYTKTSGAMTTLAADNYSLSNGVLTIKSSYTDTVISAGVTSRPYTITFNNNASTVVTVTLRR